MECVAMVQGRRIRTFIDAFDEKLDDGLPEGHFVLLAGEPGIMKSIIAFIAIFQDGLRDGRPGPTYALQNGILQVTRIIAEQPGLGVARDLGFGPKV